MVIIAIALSFIFDMPMEVTGTLGVFMAVVSVFGILIFNHYFEKVEHNIIGKERSLCGFYMRLVLGWFADCDCTDDCIYDADDSD